jgi:hypothetical protein
MPNARSSVGTGDEKLLKEIRDTFDYFVTRWSDTRSEAKKDMKFVAGDPWEPSEKRARQDGEGNWVRPCLVMDELSQYLNQVINNVRQNKRTGKVIPEGAGANDKTAENLENIIRGIEYGSKAQAAYITGLENQIQRSYGAWEICTEYESNENAGPRSFNQVLCVKRIANPDTVYPDPDAKEADFSDMMKCFKVTSISHDSFKAKYPDAEIRDFDSEHMEAAPRWIKLKEIQVGEYWKIKIKPRTLVLVDGGAEGPTTHWKDELPKNFNGAILKERKCEQRQVCQYITNGIEILEENELPGNYIRIVIVIGKELWIDDGTGSKRVLLSLIRLARDPQMLYNYMRTAAAEVVGMTPKTPYLGVVGQFSTETDWQNIHKIPVAYAEYNAKTENTGEQILPPPQRLPYEPQIQPLEIGAEAARRAIQAAMGITALPTAAQRQSEKSGVALERIQTQQSIGSYHFIDNYDRSLEHTWRMLAELVPIYYDTARDVPVRNKKEEHATLRINDPQYMNPKTNQVEHNLVSGEGAGDHDVTISTGPSYDSQREEAAAYADTLANIPGVFPQIGDLLTKLRNLGPIGDEIAERLTPPQYQSKDGQPPIPPQAMQVIQQGAAKLQAAETFIQQLQTELAKLQKEKDGKVVDNEYNLKVVKANNETKIAIAEISTKAQNTLERARMAMEAWLDAHGAAHEAGLQATEHAHEKDLASQAQDAAAQEPQQVSQ